MDHTQCYRPMGNRIEITLGDITQESTDAVVNAANADLTGGSGVNGALHEAAGVELPKALKKIGGCHTGQSVITPGFNLKTPWIIHSVGPIWHGGSLNEEQLLASCYTTSLNLAKENNLVSISFPSLATGVYGYPVALAAKTAIRAIAEESEIDLVRIVTFDENTRRTYTQALHEYRYLGRWINQNGSELNIQTISVNRIEGTFKSKRGRVKAQTEYPVQGIVDGDILSFNVHFYTAQSITSFSGRLNSEGNIATVWVLARSFSDSEKTRPTEDWNSLLVNSDVFFREDVS